MKAHRPRRRLVRALSFLVAALLVALVVSKIRFKDHYRIRTGGDPVTVVDRTDVVDARLAQDRWILKGEDGREHGYPAADVVVETGLISLLSRADRTLMIFLFLLNAAPLVLTALRWQVLLRSEGIDVPFRRVFMANHAGAFLNHVLPGSVSGDIAKIFLLPSGSGRSAAIGGTVLLTRVIGLAVTAAIAGVGVSLFFHRFPDGRVPLVVYGLIGGLTAVCLAYALPPVRDAIRKVVPRIQALEELNRVLVSSTRRKTTLLAVVALSLLTQAAVLAIAFGLGRALAVERLSLWAILVAHPIAGVVTAVPVTPGGLGVREAAFVYLFGALAGISPTEAIALAVLERTGWLVMTLPGCLFLASFAGSRAPEKEPTARGGLGLVNGDGVKD